jgi:ankyrin repeat protein
MPRTEIATPPSRTSGKGRVTAMESLLGVCIDRALTVATLNGNAIKVKELLEREDLDLDRKNGGAMLCSAALDGHEEIVKLYLAAGVDKNACDGCGRSALYLASGYHSGIMMLLIEAGADINSKDFDCQTPLMRAADKDHREGVKILLKARSIEIDHEDKDGETALSLAKLSQNEEIMALLGRKGE